MTIETKDIHLEIMRSNDSKYLSIQNFLLLSICASVLILSLQRIEKRYQKMEKRMEIVILKITDHKLLPSAAPFLSVTQTPNPDAPSLLTRRYQYHVR